MTVNMKTHWATAIVWPCNSLYESKPQSKQVSSKPSIIYYIKQRLLFQNKPLINRKKKGREIYISLIIQKFKIGIITTSS